MEATLEEELNAIFEANDSFQKQGFKQLFTKYVYQDGHANVAWEEIKKPPPDSVSDQSFKRITWKNFGINLKKKNSSLNICKYYTSIFR